MNKETLGTVLAVITAIVSGIAIPANKTFIIAIDPAVFTAVRSIMIGIVFLALSLWFTHRTARTTKKRFAVSWKYLGAIAIIGGALAFLLYFTGLKLTTASHAAFLHKTLPLYVAVLAFIFLKERITRRYAVAMAFMILGTIAIYATTLSPTEFWTNPQLGDLLVISATFLWAVENVLAKKAMDNGDSNWIVSFSRMFFGGVILFGVVLLTGNVGALFALTGAQLANIVISTALLFGYVLFYYASLRYINVSKAAVLLLLAPVITLAIGVTMLGEPAPLLQLAGSVTILVGAYVMVNVKSEQRAI